MRSLEAECSTSVQQRAGSGSRRCADPEMLRPHDSADPDHRSANWGHLELGAQLGHKIPPACLTDAVDELMYIFAVKSLTNFLANSEI